MAVLQMQRISICGLKKDRKQILETMQRLGVVEVDKVLKEDSVFTRTDMSSSQSVFDKGATSAQQALDILNELLPEKTSMLSSLAGKEELSVGSYYDLCDECDNVMKHAYHIIAQHKEIAEYKAAIVKLKAQVDSLDPWLALDAPLDFKGTKTTAAFIGTFSDEMTLEQLYTAIAEAQPEIGPYDATIISSSKEQTCVFVLCRRSDMSMMEDALRANSFSYPSVSVKDLPAEAVASMQDEILDLTKKIEEAEEEIKSFEPIRGDLKFMVDYYTMRADKYAIIGKLLQSHRTFILTGYIPERYQSNLEKALDQFDVAIEYETPGPKDDVPVVLKNGKFTEPVEGVLQSFGLPKKGEVDPSAIMAITYYILFGLMLSDTAYGLILMIGTGFLLLKYKNMAQSMRKALSMFFFCGISTTFWGILFGGYFGDAVNIISKTFFGTEVAIEPVWFAPLNNPMQMLVFALLLGVIHIFIGLGIAFFQLWKAKKYKDAFYDVVSWFVMVLGLIFLFLPTEMFQSIAQTDFAFPAILGKIGSYMALVGVAVIILFGGRSSKNPVKRIVKGLYEVYGATSYLSDILSYSRLLALGLSTGVIASVANSLGSMGLKDGLNIGGIILFVVVFVVMHVFNLAISGLGAYVHTNRLEFVEFFSRFYEGGGREFEPFAVNSQYYLIKEETKK